jgi:hypothetical protein
VSCKLPTAGYQSRDSNTVVSALVASLIKITMVYRAINTIDPTCSFSPTFCSIRVLIELGIMLRLFYTIIAEMYVVIITASVPPLNALMKRMAQSMSGSKASNLQQSDNTGQGRITVEDLWNVQYAPSDGRHNVSSIQTSFPMARDEAGPYNS